VSKIQNDDVTYQDTGNSVWKNRKKRKPIIKLGTTILPIKDIQYLGIILNQKLNFSKHIYTSLKKVETQFNKILTLANRQYNLPSEKVQNILQYYISKYSNICSSNI
jgi:hypothetical protein